MDRFRNQSQERLLITNSCLAISARSKIGSSKATGEGKLRRQDIRNIEVEPVTFSVVMHSITYSESVPAGPRDNKSFVCQLASHVLAHPPLLKLVHTLMTNLHRDPKSVKHIPLFSPVLQPTAECLDGSDTPCDCCILNVLLLGLEKFRILKVYPKGNVVRGIKHISDIVQCTINDSHFTRLVICSSNLMEKY